jgi:hypothetical protein
MFCRSAMVCVWLSLAVMSADMVTLKDGSAVKGTFLGGSARQIRVAVGDRIQTFDIENITSIQFGPVNNGPAAQTAPDPSVASYPDPAAQHQGDSGAPPDPAANTTPAPDSGIEMPAGTVLTVRMIDPIDSQVNRLGETFRASMDEPVTVGGQQVIPRGADVVVKLVDDQESGRIAGRTVLTLDLVSVNVNGKIVDVNTQAVSKASSSRGERSGKVIGGTAVLGTIIGALAGGGRGAAIGAASGAAAGTGAEVATKGQRVHIPSETRLTFTLAYPVHI